MGADHPNLLKNMMALLNPGGVLAVQTPINEQEPIHQIIKQTVSEEKWVSSFPNPRVFYNLSVGAYHDVLAALSDHFSYMADYLLSYNAFISGYYGMVPGDGT